ncbi:MAG: DUF2007 domain-containing protein [Pelovirga sp.]
MKKLHAFHYQERFQAAILKNVLAREGIVCILRNEQLGAAVGEIPFIECSPELWVIDDEAWPRARMFLDAWFKVEQNPIPWQCPRCNEQNEGHFGACWSCCGVRDD